MRYHIAKAAFLLLLCFVLAACARNEADSLAHQSSDEDDPLITWEVYGGDKKARRYSKLAQINRSNVEQLEVAWTYHTGDARDDRRGTIEANPIVVDSVLYVTSPALKVVALDAAAGEEIWTFDPFKGGKKARGVNRGVTYWENEEGTDKRILYAAGWSPWLYALDAETGRPIESFGDGGRVNFAEGIVPEGIGQEGRSPISATSPGIIYKDLFILGTRSIKIPGRRAGQGDVAAYNVHTGAREWIFHTIPHPGEFGNDTWEGTSWKTEGGANVWGGMSLDEERGWVFLPVATPKYSFYGGTREGKNLFTNSVVALDAATGELVWQYQIIHHDIWDWDPAAPPVLATVEHDGRQIDAVAQVSKRGDLFLLNRETGEPLFPVEERPVPTAGLPGEEAWPTQPFPVKPPPFSRRGYDSSDLPMRSEEARAYALRYFNKMKHGDIFIPPSKQGTIMLPGLRGGAHWGGAAFDSTTDILYVNDTNVPYLLKMVEAEEGEYPYVHSSQKFIAPDGFPAITPPWGTLNAIDLNTGEIVWDVPLGEYEELTERGLPPTGTDNLGGPIATAGGLVFIGASMDETFRAFDAATGEILWETKLPAGGYATPATYKVGDKQYVVIAAGGGGLLGTDKGDAVVAFALPQKAL